MYRRLAHHSVVRHTIIELNVAIVIRIRESVTYLFIGKHLGCSVRNRIGQHLHLGIIRIREDIIILQHIHIHMVIQAKGSCNIIILSINTIYHIGDKGNIIQSKVITIPRRSIKYISKFNINLTCHITTIPSIIRVSMPGIITCIKLNIINVL